MLTIFLSYDKKPDCDGSFDTLVYLEHPRKANVSYLGVMHKSQSLLNAKTCMIAT